MDAGIMSAAKCQWGLSKEKQTKKNGGKGLQIKYENEMYYWYLVLLAHHQGEIGIHTY